MKISLNWLQDFVTLKTKDPDAIARRITAGVAEVDDVEILGGLLNKCCVGKVLTFKKHPNADRLNICQVATDDGEKTVVCGGTNHFVAMPADSRSHVRERDAHAFAKVGDACRSQNPRRRERRHDLRGRRAGSRESLSGQGI
jgi:hypothetical protein